MNYGSERVSPDRPGTRLDGRGRLLRGARYAQHLRRGGVDALDSRQRRPGGVQEREREHKVAHKEGLPRREADLPKADRLPTREHGVQGGPTGGRNGPLDLLDVPLGNGRPLHRQGAEQDGLADGEGQPLVRQRRLLGPKEPDLHRRPHASEDVPDGPPLQAEDEEQGPKGR